MKKKKKLKCIYVLVLKQFNSVEFLMAMAINRKTAINFMDQNEYATSSATSFVNAKHAMKQIINCFSMEIGLAIYSRPTNPSVWCVFSMTRENIKYVF